MNDNVQPDSSVRLSKPVVVVGSMLEGLDPKKVYGERYGVDWIYGKEWAAAQSDMITHGNAVARSGWNGANQFVYWVPPASYPAQTGVAKAFFGEDSLVPYRGYFALKNAQGVVSTWVPSIGDLLADDWFSISQDELELLGMGVPRKTGGLNYNSPSPVAEPDPKLAGGKEPSEFVERLKVEEAELREKLNALTKFLELPTAPVDPVHLDLLIQQHAAMLAYAEILAKRLALLDPASKPVEPKA